MEGLEQVSDDTGCYDGHAFHLPAARQADLQHSEGERVDRWTRIARTIEGEVIPRLLLAHRQDLRPREPAADAIAFDARTPERFGHLVLTRPDDDALNYIHALLASGFPLESVYLDLLAPTARWLGQKWTDDEVSFTDVTIALTRLQRMMRLLSGMSQDPAHRGEAAGSILLAAMPNEQHMFGVLMLEEFCRREGFDVECLPTCGRADLLGAVKRRAPSVVGLSVSVDERLDELRLLIRDIRQVAGKKGTLIMVGGRCFNDQPEYVEAVGADFTAVDGRDAIRHIHSYMSNKLNSRFEP